MRRLGSTLREERSDMQNMPTKGELKWCLNPANGYGCMRKERFPEQRRSKLLPRGDGPFKVLKRINDNAYKLDLPGEYNVSATFNVADLSNFDADDDLRAKPSQDEGNEEDVSTQPRKERYKIPVGPITRARVKKFKEELHNLIVKLQGEEMDVFAKEAIKGNNQPRLVHIIRASVEGSPH